MAGRAPRSVPGRRRALHPALGARGRGLGRAPGARQRLPRPDRGPRPSWPIRGCSWASARCSSEPHAVPAPAETRLGVQETISDTLTRLGNVQEFLRRNARAATAARAERDPCQPERRRCAREVQHVATAFKPYLEWLSAPRDGSGPPIPLQQTLESAKQLSDTSLGLVRELRAAAPENARGTVPRSSAGRAKHSCTWCCSGLCWSLLFWSGYYVVKRNDRSRPDCGRGSGARTGWARRELLQPVHVTSSSVAGVAVATRSPKERRQSAQEQPFAALAHDLGCGDQYARRIGQARFGWPLRTRCAAPHGLPNRVTRGKRCR